MGKTQRTQAEVPDAHAIHCREVGQHPLPTGAQTYALFTAYKEARTRSELASNPAKREMYKEAAETARNKIAVGYLRYVIRQANQKSRDPALVRELISAGYEGLLYAITKFEPELGFTFLTYAANWVNVRMQESMYKWRVVHIPSHTRKEMVRAKNSGDNSKKNLPEEEPRISAIDNVPVHDPAQDIEREHHNRRTNVLSWLAQADLSRVERFVLIHLFGLRGGEPRTPKETGQIMFEIDGTQATEDVVEEIRDRALAVLREYLQEEGLDADDLWTPE